MRHTYNYTFVFFILGIITVFLSIKEIKSQYFFRFKFDLNNKTVIEEVGTFEIENIRFEELNLKKKDDIDFTFQERETYEIVFLKTGKTYFFAFDGIENSLNKIRLHRLIWLFSKPLEQEGIVKIRRVHIPFKESGSFRIAMITEELGCCIMGGRRFRYIWNSINSNINFVGNNKDVYGFKYVHFDGINSKSIIKKINQIPNADIYLIWLGRNEPNIKPKQSSENIIKLSNMLKERNPNSQLMILTPIPITVDHQNQKVSQTSNLLNEINSKNIEIINIYQNIIESDDWKNSLFYKGYALNDKAYSQIINYINEFFVKK